MPKLDISNIKNNDTLTINNTIIKIAFEYPKIATAPHVKTFSATHVTHGTKVYLVDAGTGPLPNLHKFREDKLNTEKNALLILNADIPDKTTVKLPKHMPTWITGTVGRAVLFDNTSNTGALAYQVHYPITVLDRMGVGVRAVSNTHIISTFRSPSVASSITTVATTAATVTTMEITTTNNLAEESNPHKKLKTDNSSEVKKDKEERTITTEDPRKSEREETFRKTSLLNPDLVSKEANNSLKINPPTPKKRATIVSISDAPKTFTASSVAATVTTSTASSMFDDLLGQHLEDKTNKEKQQRKTLESRNDLTTEEQIKEGNENLKAWLTQPNKGLLRPHQVKAIEEYYQNGRVKGVNDAVFYYATGVGKTIIFTELTKILKGSLRTKTVIIVSTEVLLKQTADTYERSDNTLSVVQLNDITTKIGSKSAEAELVKMVEKADVIIATYAGMAYLLDSNSPKEAGERREQIRRYKQFPWDRIGVVIMDEAHNAFGPQRKDMVNYIQQKECPILAFTATPWQEGTGKILSVYTLLGLKDIHDENNKGLNHLKENPVSSYPIRNAIEDGFNSPVVTLVYHPEEYVKMKVGSNKEISENEAAKINQPKYNNMVVSLYLNERDPVSKKPFRGLQGIVFCAGVQHAKDMRSAFNSIDLDLVDPSKKLRMDYVARGGKLDTFRIAEAVFAKTKTHNDIDDKKYEDIMRRYKMGGILLLTNAAKLTEGFDHKQMSVVINARPTLSKKLKTQCAGRGLRLSPENPYKICYNIDIAWDNNKKLAYFHNIIKDEQNRPCFSAGNVQKNREEQQKIDAANKINYEQAPILVPNACKIKHTQIEATIDELQLVSIKQRGTSKSSLKSTKKALELTVADCIGRAQTSSKKLKTVMQLMQELAKGKEVNIQHTIITVDAKATAQTETTLEAQAMTDATPIQRVNALMNSTEEALESHVKTSKENIRSHILTTLEEASTEISSVKELFVRKHRKMTQESETTEAPSSSSTTSSSCSSAKTMQISQEGEGEDISAMCKKLIHCASQFEAMHNRLQGIIDQAVAGYSSASNGSSASSVPVNKDEFQKEFNTAQNSIATLHQELETLAAELGLKQGIFQTLFDAQSDKKAEKIKRLSSKSKPDNQTKKKVKKDPEAETKRILEYVARQENCQNLLGLFKNYTAKYSKITLVTAARCMIKNNPNLLLERTSEGATPLHDAANRRHYGLSEMLLEEFNVDPNITDNNGNTPMFNLILTEYRVGTTLKLQMERVLLLLLRKGAKVNIRNKLGDSPLKALLSQHDRYADETLIGSLSPILLAFGATPSTEELEMPNSKIPCVATTLTNPLNVGNKNIVIEEGNTLLHTVCQHREEKMFRFILEQNVASSLTIQNDAGETPLHIIINNSSFALFEVLVHYLNTKECYKSVRLADIARIKDKSGNTPLLLCVKTGYVVGYRLEFVRALLNYLPKEFFLSKDNPSFLHAFMRCAGKSLGYEDNIARLETILNYLFKIGGKLFYEKDYVGEPESPLHSYYNTVLHDLESKLLKINTCIEGLKKRDLFSWQFLQVRDKYLHDMRYFNEERINFARINQLSLFAECNEMEIKALKRQTEEQYEMLEKLTGECDKVFHEESRRFSSALTGAPLPQAPKSDSDSSSPDDTGVIETPNSSTSMDDTENANVGTTTPTTVTTATTATAAAPVLFDFKPKTSSSSADFIDYSTLTLTNEELDALFSGNDVKMNF